MVLYATLSHSKLASWETVGSAHGHNARTIDVPNSDPQKLGVLEVVDLPGQNLTERIKNRLAEAGVAKPRSNAVLAFEDIYGASPGYWEKQFPEGWQNASIEQLRADPLVQAVEKFARAKHQENLVSIAWHFDEKSPHAHVVSVPLVTREHRRRGRRRKDGQEAPPVLKTTLAAHELRGGSKYALEHEHDEWAAFVAHLGLERGRKGSELTPEERRDRRLRDPQASLQGEKAAREREKIVENARKLNGELVEAGLRESARLISEAKTAAASQLAEAKAAEERASKILRDAEITKTVAGRMRDESIKKSAAASLAIKAAEQDREAAAKTHAEAKKHCSEAEAEKALAIKLKQATIDNHLKQMEEVSRVIAEAEQDRKAGALERAKVAADRAETEKLKAAAAAREAAIEEGLAAIADGRIVDGNEDKRSITFSKAVNAPENAAAKAELKAKISPAWGWLCRQAERVCKLVSKEKDLERRESAVSKTEAVLTAASQLLEKYTTAYNPMKNWSQQFAEALPLKRQVMSMSPHASIVDEATKNAVPTAEVQNDDDWLRQQQEWISGRGGSGRG